MQLLKLGNLIGQQWFLNEQWSFRFEQSRQLFCKWLVDSSVEVQSDVQTDGFDIPHALDGRVECVG